MGKEKRREREEDRKREKMTESKREDEVQRKKEEKKKGVKAETCFCADTDKCIGKYAVMGIHGLRMSLQNLS